MFTGAIFIFSSAIFLIICKPRMGCPTTTRILWNLASKLTLVRFYQKCFFNKIHHFSRLCHQTGCLFNWATCSIQFSHFCLFQNTILHKILKLQLWNYNHIFLRMQFSLVSAFFFSSFGYEFELIFSSYTVSWVLTFISFRDKGVRVFRSSHLEPVT